MNWWALELSLNRMHRNKFLVILLFVGQSLWAQSYYWIHLKDKGVTTNESWVPALSEKALERRQKLDIALDETDLAVKAEYVSEIKQNGVRILGASRWLNAIAVEMRPEQSRDILELEFVRTITPMMKGGMSTAYQRGSFERAEFSKVSMAAQTQFNYGNGQMQIKMMNGDLLHGLGYTGTGMKIAVFDGGFTGVDSYTAFDDLRMDGRIISTRDFIDNDANVFHGSFHGTGVLSIMAANLDAVLVGTAPDADYYLARTENTSSETPIEELAWIRAAEWADSIGVDVINSSLGYNLFDNPSDNYSYQDMNGRTAIVTLGAVMAARKGILVVSSAGNEGNDPWKYITAPGDADSILTVGAVDFQGDRAGFSSVGPTFDRRVKPNVVGPGVSVSLVSFGGNVGTSNGTSFSSPLVAGLATCLMQAHPGKDPQEVILAIQGSASQSNQPDSLLGYGIPDFSFANVVLSAPEEQVQNEWLVGTDPFSRAIIIQFPENVQGEADLEMIDLNGKLLSSMRVDLSNKPTRWETPNSLAAGVYALRIRMGSDLRVFKVIL